MRARNVTGERLLSRLTELGIDAECGYFGGPTFCIGISVKSAADAFALGAQLGNAWGKIDMDRDPKHATAVVLAFRDAQVSA